MDSEKRARAGAWLKRERERRRVSVRKVAAHFDVSTQSVYGWESGGSDFVDDDRAAGLAQVLDMDITEVRRNLGLWVPPQASGDELRDAPADDDGLQDLVDRARRERDGGDDTLYKMLLRLQGMTEQESGGRADETPGGTQQAS